MASLTSGAALSETRVDSPFGTETYRNGIKSAFPFLRSLLLNDLSFSPRGRF